MESYWEKDYRRKGLRAQRKYPNEGLIRFLAVHLPHRGKVLEIGCGTGANLWAIAKEGHQAYGVDYAPTSLKLCRQNLRAWKVKAQLQLADISTRLPFPAHYFDAIVDVVALQHLTLRQHQQSFREIKRCLKPGGKFFSYHLGTKSVSFTNSKTKKIDSFTVRSVGRGLPLHGNGQTCFLTPGKAENLLTEAGFRHIAVETVTRTYRQRQQKIEYLEIVAS